MLLNIDPATGSVDKLCDKKSPMKSVIMRMLDEFESWEEYTGMGARYAGVSHQEFQHALMALSDLISHVQQVAGGEDATAFMQFMQSMQATK